MYNHHMRKFTYSLLFLSAATQVAAQKVSTDPEVASVTEKDNTLNQYFKPVKWRNIGPTRGGRSVTACGVVNNPLVYYMGTTGGGVWKTEDGGQTWNNISDGYFKTGSVGAVAVAESDP